MVSFDIPFILVCCFLLLTLVVGIYFSRKESSFRDYAIGNKQFPTATLVATVLATSFGGGGFIRNIEQIHSLGLWWIIIVLCIPFRHWLISLLALRMAPFMQHCSMAETMGSVYGKSARLITTLSSMCCLTIVITSQITVMAMAINMCIDTFNATVITLFATSILIFYSTFGGIRSVTTTDVLQFVTLAIIILLLAKLMFLQSGKSVREMIEICSHQEKFHFSTIFQFDIKLVGLIAFLLSDALAAIDADRVQRVYMASSPIQARRVFLYSAIVSFMICSCISIIGLFIFAGAPDLYPKSVWDYVIGNVPPFFRGLLSIGLLAMAMSTADSCLNACAIMVSHDILKTIKKEISDLCQIKVAKWSTLVIGLLAMIVYFYCQDLLKLMYWSVDCALPTITAPFILAIFGFRGTSRTALIGMTTGGVFMLAWNQWIHPRTTIDGSFFAMLANGLAMMAAHYLLKQPKGVGWLHLQFDQLTYKNINQPDKINQALSDSATLSNPTTLANGHASVLTQLARELEESISFLDSDVPLYEQELEAILNKFYGWIVFFKKKEKSNDHLQATKITLEKLIQKVEVVASKTVKNGPKLLIEKISTASEKPPPYMTCHTNQVVYALVKAVLCVAKLKPPDGAIVSIQLHATSLRFKQPNTVNKDCNPFIAFQAIALVISQDNKDAQTLLKVKACYDTMDAQWQKKLPLSTDIEQDTIATIVHAHYGYFENRLDQKQPTILLVLPSEINDIHNKMIVEKPLNALTLEGVVTLKEQADAMIALMKFHDHVSKSLYKDDPIDLKAISELILLLRKHFRFKRHISGQLFYVRSVGIAQIVTDWTFHSPKVIYAALLYELVRRNCLSLDYIKQHYNFGVYAFVSNVIKIDKADELEDPALIYVKNRLKKVIKEEHLQLSVLFIKLAERLYDLRHAEGYIHATDIHHIAQETINIDVKIAHTYLGPEIAQLLQEAAKHALKISKMKEQEREKEKNKDQDKS